MSLIVGLFAVNVLHSWLLFSWLSETLQAASSFDYA